MFTFKASLQNELRKLFARKKYIVFLIIEVGICLIWAAVNAFVVKISHGTVPESWLIGGLQMSMLGFFVWAYIPLLVFMAACDLYAGEAHDGTIRATFMRPVSRGKQYFSKVLAIFIMASIYMIVLLLLTTAIKAIGAATFAGLWESTAAYILDLIPMIVLILFAAMINQFSNSTSLSVILCIILYMGMLIAGILIPQLSGHLFTGYLHWHTLWLGIILPFRAIITKIGILAGYSIIFGAVGYYLFERKEM